MPTVFPQHVLSKDDGTTYDLSDLAAVGTVGAPTGTATPTSVNSSASSVQLVAANTSRKGLMIQNTDANALYVKLGTTATVTDFSVMLESGDLWVMDPPIYTGRVDGIWAADGSGLAAITEL